MEYKSCVFMRWWKIRRRDKPEDLAYEEWLFLGRPSVGFPKKKKAKKSKKAKKPFKTPDYKTYINSKLWKSKSLNWRKQAGKCEICGSTEMLDCHHLHYRTLGREKRKDIQVVCRECHKKIHGKDF